MEPVIDNRIQTSFVILRGFLIKASEQKHTVLLRGELGVCKETHTQKPLQKINSRVDDRLQADQENNSFKAVLFRVLGSNECPT